VDSKCVIEAENIFANRLDIKDKGENKNDLHPIINNLSLLWPTTERNPQYLENLTCVGYTEKKL
jgi:hypothetical protein